MQNDSTLQAIAESLVDARHAGLPLEAVELTQAGSTTLPTYEELLPYLLLPMAGAY
jgi:hypothetical protein